MAVGDRLSSTDFRNATELELLLPFHATGTLSDRDAGSIDRGLATFPALARRYRKIQCERIDIVRVGDSLGRPSDRAFARLMAAVTDRCASKRRMAKGEAAVTATFGH
ncbi:MAG: hypothetical protein R3D62_06250 [Xanthobacteraceae bacterium]